MSVIQGSFVKGRFRDLLEKKGENSFLFFLYNLICSCITHRWKPLGLFYLSYIKKCIKLLSPLCGRESSCLNKYNCCLFESVHSFLNRVFEMLNYYPVLSPFDELASQSEQLYAEK